MTYQGETLPGLRTPTLWANAQQGEKCYVIPTTLFNDDNGRWKLFERAGGREEEDGDGARNTQVGWVGWLVGVGIGLESWVLFELGLGCTLVVTRLGGLGSLLRLLTGLVRLGAVENVGLVG